MFPRHPGKQLKLHQFVSFDVGVMLLIAFKALFTDFAIAHAKIKIVMLIKIGHNCVAKKPTR